MCQKGIIYFLLPLYIFLATVAVAAAAAASSNNKKKSNDDYLIGKRYISFV